MSLEEGTEIHPTEDLQKMREVADKTCIREHAGVAELDDILRYSNTIINEVGHPCYYIALDHSTKSIVIAVRGTATAHDALTDLACEAEPFLEGEAHSGIAQGAKVILEESRTLLEELINSTGYGIVVTGHSLGAGTAILLTMLIMETVGQHIDVKCWAFAPPPVFRPLDKANPRCASAIKAVCYRHDVVPRLCLASVVSLLCRLKVIDQMPWSIWDRFRYATGALAMTSTDIEALETAYGSMMSSGPSRIKPLWIPGSIAWVLESDTVEVESGVSYQMHHSSPEEFADVILKVLPKYPLIFDQTGILTRFFPLQADLLMSHLPSSYENGLKAVIENNEGSGCS